MTGSAEPTLPDVLRLLWRARASLFIGGVLGCVGAALFLLFSIPHYRISMLVAPAEQTIRVDIKYFLPENSGFALQDAAGRMAAPDMTDFTRFEYTLRGRNVARGLTSDQAVMDGLRRDRKFVFIKPPALKTADDLTAYFNKKIAVAPVGDTPLRRIVFDHPEPEFGMALLNTLYARTDALIRQDMAATAKARALYLKDMLDKTSHPDHRRALTALLMEQEHRLMILAMEEPFAAIITEPPAASVRPWWPRKNLIFAGFAFAGALLGFALRGAK